VAVAISPIKNRSGELIGVSAITHDITDRKRAETEVLELNTTLERRVEERTAQLQAANRELETFSYSVSHDLRAPLRAVEGFAQILLRDYPGKVLDETAADYMKRMSAATHRMGQLISDLLTLSRLSRQEISRKPVNLSEIADGILTEYRSREPQRQVNIEVQPGLVADADPQLARVALENILGNAWKYTGKISIAKISFGAIGSHKETAFFVRDNGAGFDMAFAEHLFAPFQRLHRSEEFEGNGIGLATVQRVIRRHGGRVWAEAQPGQGAVFYFTLGAI
jgi:light-regulated signal transduction histidine kinase (bacteriophytochrome)